MNHSNPPDVPSGAMDDAGPMEAVLRQARASGRLRMKPETLEAIRGRHVAAGDVLEIARAAGIVAAKRTAELIPLCQPVCLAAVEVAFDFPDDHTIAVEAIARARAVASVGTEALLAVVLAALTVQDMCKAIDPAILIEQIRLEEESGGQSGHFVRRG